ncbi:MAG: 16S rRNA (adenine(1518)-N(6)/adenine(1519)-N(6))-dimethyltransferase RsmA [Clostridia bacterium]|nr:16S rRNA (adenine(1518)-N(6)/adenine(1519)-N(6))-dimethyltransferase RsmA [Clostridia bacterium]
MEFEYKKSLGQNFIYDLGFLRALIKKLNVQTEDVVVEVGAGAGTLTQVRAETGCRLYSLEIDQRLQSTIENRIHTFNNANLIMADALMYDFSKLPPFRLIANVPYYITTPLIMKFLSLPNCLELNVLVAAEVAERIVSPHNTALYGALSVTCQLQADCKIIAKVPRTMFTPQPKIDSAFISLKKNNQITNSAMEKLLKGVFAARRKTMVNALSSALKVDKTIAVQILTEVGIDLTLRPEQVTPTEYAKMCAISHK